MNVRQRFLVMADIVSFRFLLAHSARLDAKNHAVGDAETREEDFHEKQPCNGTKTDRQGEMGVSRRDAEFF